MTTHYPKKSWLVGFFYLKSLSGIQEAEMSSNQNGAKNIINDSIIKDIRDAVEKLGFGTVTITVHNKKITQIEIAEKKRFDSVWAVEEGGGI